MSALTRPLVVHLPDTRNVELSRYGCGNLKLGDGVYTYSRLAGSPTFTEGGTCPGATTECEAICYAKRIGGIVKREVYLRNGGNDVPAIPDQCKVLRIHVSGDFDTPEYILAWVARLKARPDVACWAYTRSWRCASLLEFLDVLRALPNVQLFASMDSSTKELPPVGWRRAWIDGDERAGAPWRTLAHQTTTRPDEICAKCSGPKDDTFHDIRCPDDAGYHDFVPSRGRNQLAFNHVPSLICPEETKHKANCVDCGYCFLGERNDVTFLRH